MTEAAPAPNPPVRLAYLVSHPIQYQAPLLRRIAQQPSIDLTVLFGSDFSLRSYQDDGFGVAVEWDVPLLGGYKHEFLPAWRDTGSVSPTSPISRGLIRRLQQADGSPAFDALWVHGYAGINSLLAMIAARALGIPVLLRADIWLGDRPRNPRTLFAKQLFFRALKTLVAGVLPIGTLNAEYWTHYFGDPATEGVPQFLMPYAVDNDFFRDRALAAAPHQAALRARLGLDEHRPVILFASKLQERKHCNHLIEAYRRMLLETSADRAPYLVIVGDGEMRAALEATVREQQLDGVRFAGFQNQTEIPRYFELASVFVLPARHEPWGLIVNEAMASGCPVIATTDCGCAPDLITDGENGFIYPTSDSDAQTTALRNIFAAPDTPRRLGENAHARIQHWSFNEDMIALRQALAAITHKLRA